ncbi:SGNH/GDSL hydrolase family protein [Olivibacter sp. SDN3]|uniref:SGNH/GDSL hydrolase family protein n=1 Tax=Olivibacter sp. SDN3 TaxID=2764720 RepID=UPI002107F634|nr:SGNH/GDSL hydrolase family protein [Olivibacter sp. SDN3]
MVLKQFFFCLAIFSLPLQGVMAQEQAIFTYKGAEELTLIGKAVHREPFYHRVDTADYPELPKQVKSLLTHSAGLAITFKTNSPTIAAKWCTSPRRSSANMTAIAFEGLDLYIKKDGFWQYAGVGQYGDSCSTSILASHMDDTEKECLLYLPLYDEISEVEIGVTPGSSLSALKNPFKKKIIVYGSSIVQGASASRPGLAYPARLSRETGWNFVNLGLSGSAKMEKSVANMLSTMDADAFVLDCIPNASPQEIKERTAYLIKSIRQSHPEAPIVMIQTIIREHGYFNQQVGRHVKEQNEMVAQQVKALSTEVDNLYLITAEDLLGNDHEGTTDGTHPNDLGFDRMLRKIQPTLMDVLKF